MAIDVKQLFVDAIMELCKVKPLSKITVADILEKTGASRQAFYNHFKDKQDLIQYCYHNRITTQWHIADSDFDYYNSLLDYFMRIEKYHQFMKQACMMNCQNNLTEHMLDFCREFDYGWHEAQYGSPQLPAELRFATEYHAQAAISMTISWILSDMPSSPSVMAENITRMRNAGLSSLLYKNDSDEKPYCEAAEKAAACGRS